MACHTLRRDHVRAEGQIANESSDSYSNHDPAVVGHEQEPAKR